MSEQAQIEIPASLAARLEELLNAIMAQPTSDPMPSELWKRVADAHCDLSVEIDSAKRKAEWLADRAGVAA